MPPETGIYTKAFDGQVCSGLGAARGNLVAQLPLIAPDYPEIRNCHYGTINIALAQPLHIAQPDFMSKPIEWMQGVTEIITITEVQFEYPAGSLRYRAWLYVPQSTPHRFNDRHAEIIAATIDNLKTGQPCRLHVRAAKIQPKP